MFPSWGNFGGQHSQNYGGPGPRKPPGSGLGGFEPPSSGSLFSSLQEQHRQQMQQLQMLHQKQLQSVLQHGNHANSFGGGHSGGHTGTPWHSELPGPAAGGVGAPPYFKQDETPVQPMKGAPAPQQGHQQPPPPPPQPSDSQPVPPPPESPSLKPQENNGAPAELTKNQAATADDKSLPLQVLFLGAESHHHFIWPCLLSVNSLVIKKISKYILNTQQMVATCIQHLS